MKKTSIRALSVIISAFILVSCFTFSAFAADVNTVSAGGDGGADGNVSWGWSSGDNTLSLSGTGFMKGYDENNLPPWYYYRYQIERIVVGDGITSIGNYAFYGLINAKSIYLSNTLMYIGGSAFCNCDSLESISIPKSVQDMHPNVWAGSSFANFEVDALNQKYLSLDGHLYSYNNNLDLVLNKYANTKLSKVYTVPDTVVSISDYAFDDCRNLTRIEISKNVSDISGCAIHDCPALTAIEAVENSKYFYSQSGVLFKKGTGNDASLLRYPPAKSTASYTVPDTTSAILDDAFYNCVKLKSVTIPDSVKKINAEAFLNCSKLTRVDLGINVKDIDKRAFCCSALKSVYVPQSVKSIGKSAFGYKLGSDNELTKVSGFKLYYVKDAANLSKISEYCGICNVSSAFLTLGAASLKAGATKSIVPKVGIVKSWVSNKKSVAAVKNGTVTALKKGSATITATLADGSVLTRKVTVKTNPKLSKKSVTVKKGKTVSVKIKGKVKTINNAYTNTKFAKITSAKTATTLKVKGLQKGSTKLKVKVNGYTLSLKVTVK